VSTDVVSGVQECSKILLQLGELTVLH